MRRILLTERSSAAVRKSQREEIIDAIRRPLGARSLDGIKRRTRAGMGRCQAGFCSTKVMDILARELGIPLEEVTESRRRVQDADGGER